MSNKSDEPKIFRVTFEVGDLGKAAAFYTKLLSIDGKRHPGARHYFDCGGVLLAVLDVSQGGMKPTPNPKSLYFAVNDLEAVHARAKALKALAPYKVHGEPAGDVIERPWGEKSFYATDPWGNELCFVQEGTLYTQALWPHLLALAEGKKSEALLFGYHDRNWPRKWVGRICKAAGVPRVTVHGMRGLHGTLAVETGISAHAVAAALGHESVTTTLQSYAMAGAGASARQEKILTVLVGGKKVAESAA